MNERKLRIVFLIGSMREGGSENQVVLLMRGLRERGHEVSLMLLHYEGVRLQELLAEDFEVYDVDLPRFRPKWNPLPWLRLPFVLLRSAQFIRRKNPDVLHAWLFWAHLWARLCLFLLPRIPFVTSRRQTAHAGRLLKIEGWNNRRADVVIGNSTAVMNSVKELEENLPGRLEMIPNGVNLQRIDGATAANLRADFLPLADASMIGICVANLLPVKDYPNLLRAWALVVEKEARAKLLCVGADGGELAELVQLRRELNLEQHVIFAGSRADVASLVKGADFGVLASSDEGLSNAMLEYMACGKPAVVTEVSGAREAVENGRSGFIVPTRNSTALAEAMLRIIQDESRRRIMGCEARKSIEEKFSLDVMIERHIEIYRSILRR